ncbi:MAG: hypothetical protein HZC12_02940 [Nitrospirae bacterium]|nr:hypothetical protein [Nitrospirota bacterium]
MASIKEKIIKEVEKIPKDKIAELYDVVHLFRVEIESKKKAPKDRYSEAVKFFGIWKGMSPKETAVLDDIQARRKRTYRERIL